MSAVDMKSARGLAARAMGSMLVALGIWLLFSWPLPRHVRTGISSASLSAEKGQVRAMIPGDHLQFLYQFWLAADTLKGHTAWFHNPYEFNAGDDATRRFRGTYYVPFSLFYAAAAPFGGRAFGYNAVQFVTLWLTLLFTWLLVRRYGRDPAVNAAAAVIGVAVPYFWITMLDGSPTGLAMMWVPMIFWALDVMVKERRMWAGAAAGLGVCLAESDTHVFFFVVLAVPVWCAFSYGFHFPARRPTRGDMASMARASVLLVGFLGVAALQAWHIRHGLQEATVTARGLGEILTSSPPLVGVWRLQNVGEGRKIYVGGYLTALLLTGLGVFLWRRARSRESTATPWLPVVLLCLGVTGVVLLSTGPRNPAGPAAWSLFTKLVPPYAMIRQPHKIYCLMPALLALASAILLPGLLGTLPAPRRRIAALALMIPLLFDYSRRIQPTVCLLRHEQGAFRAIAEDARKAGNEQARLLALPLWPGDSHYDSLNEHYVSLYHLRMVNGYGGTVKKWFRDEIFLPFESMNGGGIDEAQLDELLRRGIGYVVLHEDCFPEKVSPFPVGHTLQALLNHPRLVLTGRDSTVWAFRILPADASGPGRPRVSFMTYSSPSRLRELEREVGSGAGVGTDDPTASGGRYARLAEPGSWARTPTTLMTLDADTRGFVRVRGQGALSVSIFVGPETNEPVPLVVAAADWQWVPVSVPGPNVSQPVALAMTLEQGAVDLDAAFLWAGAWAPPAIGKTLDLPAACFFHAGYTERHGDGVVLRKDYEPTGAIFYGPRLPLEAGRYSAELVYYSEAPDGAVLGEFSVRGWGEKTGAAVPMAAGSKCAVAFEPSGNGLLVAAFDFHRVDDVKILKVVLTRLE